MPSLDIFHIKYGHWQKKNIEYNPACTPKMRKMSISDITMSKPDIDNFF